LTVGKIRNILRNMTSAGSVEPEEAPAQAVQADLFGKVFVLAQHLTRRTDAALEPLGLTSRQWLLLAVLTRGFQGRSPSLTEAAERYGSSRQNVKQVALGLEAQGYLRLVADPLDGRTTRLELTHKVRLFDAPDGVARARALFADVFAGLSPQDVVALRRLVVRWLDALTGERGGAPAVAQRRRRFDDAR
jgi:DNA-binding MarR family transcriptional regulator